MSRRSVAVRLTLTALVAPLLAFAQPSAAEEEEPHPDYTVHFIQSLCGTFNLGTLTIDTAAEVRVATVADSSVSVPSRSGDPSVPNCAAGAEGTLTINAERIVVNGTIDGNGTQSTPVQPGTQPGSPATGNGGGGHGGDGGNGSTGDGGDGYGDTTQDPVTEVGAPGGGNVFERGRGGARIVLNATGLISANGVIRADGTAGASNIAGTCGDGTVPFSGVHAPGGGGAGGGIVLNARILETSGILSAAGGNGGAGRAGGGGGGAGGVVKVIAPVQKLFAGFSVDVSGGSAGGGNCTTGDLPTPAPVPGDPGSAGVRVDDATPVGTAFAPATFWNRGTVQVPIDAAASYSGSTPSGFTVYICGVRSSTPGPATPPAVNSPSSPCGLSMTQLASKSFTTLEVTPADANGFVNLPLAGAANDGYWAIWAAVVRGSGFTAAVSDPPAVSQAEFAVDNTPPSLTITAPAEGFTVFYDQPVPSLDFTALDPVVFGDPSGINGSAECRNELPAVTAFEPCTSGNEFTLTAGVGPRRIGVRVTDVAGNVTERQVSGTILAAPTALEAEPAVVLVKPKDLNFFTLTARLIRTDTSQPLAGQLISMTVPRTGTASPVVICTALTNADGVATCGGKTNAAKVAVSKGYRAVFAGSAFYDPAADEAPLITRS